MEWRRGRERHDVIGGDYFYAKKKNCDLEIGVAAYVSRSGFRSLLEKNQQKQKKKKSLNKLEVGVLLFYILSGTVFVRNFNKI